MKKQFVLLFAALVLLASCGGKADKKDEVKEEKTTENTDNSTASSSDDNSSSPVDESTRRIEELKKVPPLTNDQLKSFFPEEVMGLKRESFSVSNSLGYAIGSAAYGSESNADYNVVVYDCAGENGSAFYGAQYYATLNMESETQSGYTKTVNYKGTKALENFQKSNNEHQLHFLYADRFWMSVTGHEGIDKLKSFIDALDLDKLKSMK